MGLTWVLAAPGRPHVGHMNLAIRIEIQPPTYWQWVTLFVHAAFVLCDNYLERNNQDCGILTWFSCNMTEFLGPHLSYYKGFLQYYPNQWWHNLFMNICITRPQSFKLVKCLHLFQIWDWSTLQQFYLQMIKLFLFFSTNSRCLSSTVINYCAKTYFSNTIYTDLLFHNILWAWYTTAFNKNQAWL